MDFSGLVNDYPGSSYGYGSLNAAVFLAPQPNGYTYTLDYASFFGFSGGVGNSNTDVVIEAPQLAWSYYSDNNGFAETSASGSLPISGIGVHGLFNYGNGGESGGTTGLLANEGDIHLQMTVTPIPIPVPAAVYLFGSALGVMGWMRRKAAS